MESQDQLSCHPLAPVKSYKKLYHTTNILETPGDKMLRRF